MSSLLENLPPDLGRQRVLSTRQACEFVGISVAHWRRIRAHGEAPAPILIGTRKHGWKVADLIDWIASRSQSKAAA
jgi:predicted DNA-binding transcriptional regulator AlpA